MSSWDQRSTYLLELMGEVREGRKDPRLATADILIEWAKSIEAAEQRGFSKAWLERGAPVDEDGCPAS